MKTYFIRHTWTLNISKPTLDGLTRDHLIAIHYPNFTTGWRDVDNESWDPATYDRPAGNILRRFLALAASGGYVCAEYHAFPGWLIGTVDPDSVVEVVHGRWRDFPDRVAALKEVSTSNADPSTWFK